MSGEDIRKKLIIMGVEQQKIAERMGLSKQNSRLEGIDYGSPYVLITRTDRLLKYIYPSERGTGYYRLVSKDAEKHPSYDIEFGNILFLYKVVGLLRRSQL